MPAQEIDLLLLSLKYWGMDVGPILTGSKMEEKLDYQTRQFLA
jgi:hypothetical protein